MPPKEPAYALYAAAAIAAVLLGYACFAYLNLLAMSETLEMQREALESCVPGSEQFAEQARIYADMVQEYNSELRTFPENFIAPIFGFREIES